MEKEIILTEKESKAFKERISQKTDIPISAINIYKLNYNPITVIRIDLELLNLIEKVIQKIAIIPDVHGRKFWRRVVEEDADKIIFLGDYGDPYGSEEISHKDALIELEEIIRFQEENPNKVVLLLGNHDAHYLSRSFSPCSRYSHKYASEYYDLLANRVEFL